MRILFLTQKFAPARGGVAVSAKRIACGLATRCEGVDVVHLSRDLPAATVEQSGDDRLRVFKLGEAEDSTESLQLMEQLARSLHLHRDYTVIVGFYAVPVGAVAVATAEFFGLPSLVSLRGNDVDRAFYHPGRSALLQWTLARATRVVAVSGELQHKAGVISGRDDVEQIANSVDAEVFFPEPSEAGGPAQILFCGEMRFKKGLDLLLPALEQVKGEWRLVLAGGFRERSRQRLDQFLASRPDFARRLEVRRYVRDEGQLRQLYCSSRLVVNPALWEGMPNAVLEAMACARPVLATAVGGVPELLEDGVNGWLVPVDRLDTLGQRIQAALEDGEAEAMGRRARQTVLDHYRPEQELEAYAGCLQRLTSSARSS